MKEDKAHKLWKTRLRPNRKWEDNIKNDHTHKKGGSELYEKFKRLKKGTSFVNLLH